MVEVVLSVDEMIKCRAHSEAIVKKYGGNKTRGSGVYNHNSNGGNIVGVKGEMGTAKWLEQNLPSATVVRHFEDFQAACGERGDIEIVHNDGGSDHGSGTGHVIEVKSLQHVQWETYKRMIPHSQLDGYVEKEAIIVWATASKDDQEADVILRGWNYAHEVKDKGVWQLTVCLNHWLPKDADMHAMEEFASAAASTTSSPGRHSKRIKTE